MVYLISYDISDSLYDYTSLVERIKKMGDYQHPMKYLWFVRADDTNVNEISDSLRAEFKSNTDHLFVTEFRPDTSMQGWLPRSFWQWLKQR